MRSQLQNEIFDSLHISKDKLLDEMGILLASHQLSEYSMEISFFEQKYQSSFDGFDAVFQQKQGSLELEDDWMAWKFAEEGKTYWQTLLQKVKP